MSAAGGDFIPRHDVASRHEILVAAPAERVWQALHRVDFGRSRLVGLLLAFRGMRPPWGRRRPLRLDDFLRSGFLPLDEHPGRRRVLGIAGRFWTPRGDVRRLTPAEFARFEDPGYARAVWTFEIEDVAPAVSRLVTQTRVVCNGNRAKRLFRAYWLIVGPFSGFLRREMLRAIRTDAETPELRSPGMGVG